MIQITGLTHRQREIIDILWNCQSLGQAEAVLAALPYKDGCDGRSLLQIAAWECTEQEQGLDTYADAANTAIRNASS